MGDCCLVVSDSFEDCCFCGCQQIQMYYWYLIWKAFSVLFEFLNFFIYCLEMRVNKKGFLKWDFFAIILVHCDSASWPAKKKDQMKNYCMYMLNMYVSEISLVHLFTQIIWDAYKFFWKCNCGNSKFSEG